MTPTAPGASWETTGPTCGPHGGIGWLWVPIVVLGAVIGTGLLLWALGGAPSPSSYPGPFVGWPVFPLGFLLVVVVVFSLTGWAWRGRGWGGPTAWMTPEQTVRARFARGEITAEEMRRMTDELRRTG